MACSEAVVDGPAPGIRPAGVRAAACLSGRAGQRHIAILDGRPRSRSGWPVLPSGPVTAAGRRHWPAVRTPAGRRNRRVARRRISGAQVKWASNGGKPVFRRSRAVPTHLIGSWWRGAARRRRARRVPGLPAGAAAARPGAPGRQRPGWGHRSIFYADRARARSAQRDREQGWLAQRLLKQRKQADIANRSFRGDETAHGLQRERTKATKEKPAEGADAETASGPITA